MPLVLVAILAAARLGACLNGRWRAAAGVLAAAAIVLAAAGSVRLIRLFPRDTAARRDRVAGAERAAGDHRLSGRAAPLPALAAAHAGVRRRYLAHVASPESWRKKLTVGGGNLGMKAEPGDLPRALSEEHMIQERGIRRGWFILAGNPASDLPRFNVRGEVPHGEPGLRRRRSGPRFCQDGRGPDPHLCYAREVARPRGLQARRAMDG